MTKLYELPRDKNIKIDKVECSDGSNYITFHHIDGMYSYCTTEKGGVVHLACWTELLKIDDHTYELAPQDEQTK